MATTVVVLTSGTSWTVPTGCYEVAVECLGAGGPTGPSAYTGGGGGGAYSKLNSLTVTPGASISCQIGDGTSTTDADRATWFSSTSTVFAEGGGASNGYGSGTGGEPVNGIGDVKYAGGFGGSFPFSLPTGGGGGSAGPGGAGSDGSTPTGGTAYAYTWESVYSTGDGGDGGGTGTSGQVGNDYGGGAGGNGDGATFNAGGDGLIVITYTPVVGYIVSASAASFTETGTSVSFLKDSVVKASSGPFTETGASVGLTRGSLIHASSSDYGYSGASVGVFKGLKVVSSAGAYSAIGASAGAYKDSIIHVSAGSFTYTGTSAETLKGFKTLASSSSYLYSGVPVNFYRGLKVLTSSGTFVETGASVSLLKYAKIEAEGTEYEYDSAVASGRLKVTTTTDSNGDFSTTLNLSPGTYSIRARQTVDSSIGPWTDYQRFSVTT